MGWGGIAGLDAQLQAGRAAEAPSRATAPSLSAPCTPSTHSCSSSPACEGKTGNLPGALGSWQRHPQPRASNAAALQVGKAGERAQRAASSRVSTPKPNTGAGGMPAEPSTVLVHASRAPAASIISPAVSISPRSSLVLAPQHGEPTCRARSGLAPGPAICLSLEAHLRDLGV